MEWCEPPQRPVWLRRERARAVMKAVWGYRFNARRLQPYGVLESWYLHTFSGQPRL
jgi:hypothetical protein